MYIACVLSYRLRGGGLITLRLMSLLSSDCVFHGCNAAACTRRAKIDQ